MITIICKKCNIKYTLDPDKLKVTKDTHDKTLLEKQICPICIDQKI